MILTLVIFGLVCIIGAIVIMTIFGAVTGNVIGINLHTRKNGKPLTPLEFVVEQGKKPVTLQAPAVKSEPKYFIKLGSNKVPIDANEVKDAKKKGYEVLIE